VCVCVCVCVCARACVRVCACVRAHGGTHLASAAAVGVARVQYLEQHVCPLQNAVEEARVRALRAVLVCGGRVPLPRVAGRAPLAAVACVLSPGRCTARRREIRYWRLRLARVIGRAGRARPGLWPTEERPRSSRDRRRTMLVVEHALIGPPRRAPRIWAALCQRGASDDSRRAHLRGDAAASAAAGPLHLALLSQLQLALYAPGAAPRAATQAAHPRNGGGGAVGDGGGQDGMDQEERGQQGATQVGPRAGRTMGCQRAGASAGRPVSRLTLRTVLAVSLAPPPRAAPRRCAPDLTAGLASREHRAL